MENWKHRYQWDRLSEDEKVTMRDALNKAIENDVPFRLYDADDEDLDDMPDLCGPASYGIYYHNGTRFLVWNPEYAGPLVLDAKDNRYKPPKYIENRQGFMRSMVPYVLFHDVAIFCDEPLID